MLTDSWFRYNNRGISVTSRECVLGTPDGWMVGQRSTRNKDNAEVAFCCRETVSLALKEGSGEINAAGQRSETIVR